MKASEKQWLRHYSAHDYQALILRWEKLAKKTGMKRISLCQQGGYETISFQGGDKESSEGLYLSAGVHGDEAAPVWALLEWAEANQTLLKEKVVTLLPCVNPWGFVNNVRTDFRGRDMNRLFQNKTLPFFRAWLKLIRDRRFRLAINLHEDYDAQGIYAYELTPPRLRIAERVFDQIEKIIPRETRKSIDGLRMRDGIIRRSGDLREEVEEQLDGGWPEAIYLYAYHACSSLTFETPSEFAFHERVKAQKKFIEKAIT